QNIQKKERRIDSPLACIVVFLVLLVWLILIGKLKCFTSWQAMYVYLFLLGWYSWTFVEYMFHRFLWHSKQTNKANSQSDTFNHLYHHRHPTEIKTSVFARTLLITGSLFLIIISIWIHNYFTLLVGFSCGFAGYNLTHLLLHKKIAQKFFPKKVRYHIYHHCKYPDTCFGISVTWWDDLFGTVPIQKKLIAPKVIDFYFGKKDHKPTTSKKREVFLLLLLLFSQLSSYPQKRMLQYDVTKNGNVIGYVLVSEITKGNTVFLTLRSEVKTNLFLFPYNSFVTEEAVFEDGILISSFYYKKENGKATSIMAKRSGGYLNINSNGNVGLLNIPVRTNTLQMYFNPFVADAKAYSNQYQQFLDVKRVAENRFSLTLPDGNLNYYNYKKGVCTKVDVMRSLFTIHIVLKNQSSS
ncbi:MAG TPA: DUF6134 family protein, partial [Hanamia sp.]|nr:DUF6134 family protein [Hanamia sp.]